jgi:hypothetical protein
MYETGAKGKERKGKRGERKKRLGGSYGKKKGIP